MKNAFRYAALVMTIISSIALLSGVLRLFGTYSFAQSRFMLGPVHPFDTLFAAVACLGFGRSYQLLKRGPLDAASKTQTEIELVHVWFLCAWFCFIFIVQQMNPHHRGVSSRVLVVSVLAAVCFVADGFVLRKRLFRLSTESLPGDLSKALRLWRGAHLISFCCAISLAFVGVALKFLGSSWLLPGIFFGLSLAFLLLWKPRQLTMTGSVQPA